MDDRYSRQILFSGIGKAGQERISGATVVLLGCGALGSVAAEILARAGVGRLRIIDRDFVEWSNLQRQSLFTEADARAWEPKAVAAQRALRKINSEIEIEALVEDIRPGNIERLCAGAQILLDGSDNFELRFLLNDHAVRSGTPWVYGAALGSYGLGLLIRPGSTPCFRCLFESPPPAGQAETCETSGIIGPVIHLVSAFQAVETLKLLVGAPGSEGLLRVDLWSGQWRSVRMGERRPECPCCGRRDYEFLDSSEEDRTIRLCGQNAVQILPRNPVAIDLEELAGRIGRTRPVRSNPHLLRFAAGECEVALFSDGRAIIKGTDRPEEARSIYARYVGA